MTAVQALVDTAAEGQTWPSVLQPAEEQLCSISCMLLRGKLQDGN